MADISYYDDIIDSRDIIERIEELESERGDIESVFEDAHDAHKSALDALTPATASNLGECLSAVKVAAEALEKANDALREFDRSPAGEELATLRKLAEDGANYADDWEYGVTLIRDSYFRDYAEELANDICDMPKDVRWPFTCIDWEAAAEELKSDYTAIEFDGVTYWVR